MSSLRKTDRTGWAHVRARVRLLAEQGHELRRPAADLLRDGSYELRARHGHVQFRLLYFFHGRNIVVLAHAIQKLSARVPDADIERAAQRKLRYAADPEAHTFQGGVD